MIDMDFVPDTNSLWYDEPAYGLLFQETKLKQGKYRCICLLSCRETLKISFISFKRPRPNELIISGYVSW